jgi:hypothetical protein
MATLREYLYKYQGRTVVINRNYHIKDSQGNFTTNDTDDSLLEVLGRLHFDGETNSRYISICIPRIDNL